MKPQDQKPEWEVDLNKILMANIDWENLMDPERPMKTKVYDELISFIRKTREEAKRETIAEVIEYLQESKRDSDMPTMQIFNTFLDDLCKEIKQL